MIHIIFGASGEGSLKMVLREMGLEQKDSVIAFRDIFSTGPIWKIDEANGLTRRLKWLENNMRDEWNEYNIQYFDHTVKQIRAIHDGEQVMIWVADNAHDQTGLHFVVPLLKNVEIFIINAAKVYENLMKSDTIRYFVKHTGEIESEGMMKVYQSGEEKVLSNEERGVLEKEWFALADSQETLRIWRDSAIKSVAEDYYDAFIIEKASMLQHGQSDLIRTPRLIGEVIGNLDDYISDAFIEYRVRKLIEKGIFDWEGSLKAMRFYKVRLK